MPPFIQLVSHGSRLALGRCPTETRTAAHAGTDVSAPTSRPRPRPSRRGLRGSERFTSRTRTTHRAPRTATEGSNSVGSRLTPWAGSDPPAADRTTPPAPANRNPGGRRRPWPLDRQRSHPLPRRQPRTHEPSRADRRHPAPDEHDGAGHTDTFRGVPLDAPPSLLRQPGSAPSASRSGVY
jgi:hypothetical protein